jgi:hypothetical protein
MTMFEAWAIWSGNQPERITEGGVKPQGKARPAATLQELNERILHDIGMSRVGLPILRH